MPHIAYIDESGDASTLRSATCDRQPIFAIGGFVLPASSVRDLTNEYLAWKAQHFPGKCKKTGHALDDIQVEIKGSDLRRALRSRRRNEARAAFRALSDALAILERHDARVIARASVKAIGRSYDSDSLYTYSMQDICLGIQGELHDRNGTCFMLSDSREFQQNQRVSHSVFTRKHSLKGDPYPRLADLPSYGQSLNHAGLQLADLVVSGIIVPTAAYQLCRGAITSCHVSDGYKIVARYLAPRMKNIETQRYRPPGSRAIGGVMVKDHLGGRGRDDYYQAIA